MPLIKLTAFHTVEGLFVIKPLVDRLLRRRLLFLGCQNSGRSNRGFPCSGNQSQFKNARSFFLVNIGIFVTLSSETAKEGLVNDIDSAKILQRDSHVTHSQFDERHAGEFLDLNVV
ncbi:hypothetical protein P5673_020916 [Acropora cervicornis]|uniref:Uncharacterized protein n=1 Tax=Acropora cervicornis TaxID=6130 RepID=A0AAD9V0V1_ACRCE|nr:hypothetical protein P5673_020916 [Acropora cervicornis]